jgi:hypothetical protein
MIYTDFTLFFSDDPSDNNKELHTLAQSLGLDKGFHGNTNGRIYYYVRRKRYIMRGLMKYGALLISKQTVKNYLLSGYLNIAIITDFTKYSIDGFFWGLFEELCEYHNIDHTKYLIHKSTGANIISCRIEFEDRTRLIYKASPKNPGGIALIMNKKELVKELEVPEFLKKKLIDKARPTHTSIARNKIKY